MSQYGDSQNIIRPPFRRHTPASPAANPESPPERSLSLPQPPRPPLGTPAPNPAGAGYGSSSPSDPTNIRRRNQWREHQQLISPYAATRATTHALNNATTGAVTNAPNSSGSNGAGSSGVTNGVPLQPAMPSPPVAKRPLHLPSPPPHRATAASLAAPLRPSAADPAAASLPAGQFGGAFNRPASPAGPPPVALRPGLRRLPPPPDLSIPRESAVRTSAAPNSKVTPLRVPTQGRLAQERREGRDRTERFDRTERPNTAGRLPNRPQRKSRKTPLPVLYAIRLLILGVGVAAIAGTLLSALGPSQVNAPGAAPQALAGALTNQRNRQGASATVSSVPVTTEITRLKTALEQLATLTPGLTPSAFVLDLDSGQYVDLEGAKPVAAASTIKVPILIAFLQAVDAGTVSLDRALTLESRYLVSGSGQMQDQPVGTQYTALDVATQMIVTSDNTATNMMIDLLGGTEALNQQFQAWGLTATVLRSALPDLQGTNTTSPRDMALLLALVDRGELLSLRSRDRMWAIMQRTENRSLIPSGLSDGTIVLNKTGDIGSILGDVALIDTPTGRRYVLATLVGRPTNDGRASELIRRIASLVHRELNQPVAPVGGAATAPAGAPAGASPGTSSREGFTEGSSPAGNGQPGSSQVPRRTGSDPTGRSDLSQPSRSPYEPSQGDPVLSDPALSDPAQADPSQVDPSQVNQYPGGPGSGSGEMPGARMPQG